MYFRLAVFFFLLLFVPAVTTVAENKPDFAAKAAQLTAARTHPSLFVTATPVDGLRSVADLRAGIQTGHAKALWDTLKASVDKRATEPVVTPMQEVDGKRVLGNRAYAVVAKSANRILDTALVALVLEDRAYVDATLNQIMVLFDENEWAEWSDQAHLNAGLNADLRHGQLVVPVALAYDWLHPQLTPEERQAIIDGLDRCAITPYKKGYEAGEHWSRRKSNWMTVVLGGFGIAGMALGPDHPDSAMLVQYSLPMMESYLDILGPEGEFNESVQYAGSMSFVVRYFMAMHYASGGTDAPFERHSLDKFYEWYMMMTFPPGRVAGFGDPAADMPPVVVPAAAAAAATQNPYFQWFYEQYNDRMLDSHRNRALELLYYDASLQSLSPAGKWPLGKAYHYQGHLVSSRSSWDPVSCTSVVYAKSGREAYHGHADWGQVCVDGYGERLVVDLGAPPGYPKSGTEYYYNYQQFGHNVLVFGKNDTGGVSLRAKGPHGKTTWSEFDPERGAAWTFDLSGVYGEGYTVSRTVVHLLPRTVVVVDTARLPESMPISLRWHLADAVEPDPDGEFSFTAGETTLHGMTRRVDGHASPGSGRHAYAAPYNKHRLGTEFKQRNEPYVELTTEDDHVQFVTIFTIAGPGEKAEIGGAAAARSWSVKAPEGLVSVTLNDGALVLDRDKVPVWRVSLPPE